MRRCNGENRPARNSQRGWRFRRSLNFRRDTQGKNFTHLNDRVARRVGNLRVVRGLNPGRRGTRVAKNRKEGLPSFVDVVAAPR